MNHPSLFSNLTFFNHIRRESRPKLCTRGLRGSSIRCSYEVLSENRQVKLTNKKDSLEICRVLNGMWQTSGGWGPIDRHNAVDAMLRYADAGLTTFDMADHCTYKLIYLHVSYCLCYTCPILFTSIWKLTTKFITA